ncbi:MAG TPA: ATP-binding cassette domain-containing protein [Candidatus Limnocylindrales bacterium]|nr:ATP-binding cassette domain-containing protein [Candidatus Limnocylindrales bacterium]
MIRVSELSKSFHDKKRGEVPALAGVSFEVNPGEIFGILGPNGAGKTTMMRLLATVLSPTAGTASIAGHDIGTDPAGVRSSIGFLSGDMGLYGRLTPREILRFFGQLGGLEKSTLERRIGEVTELLDLKSYSGTRIDKLSTGMRQRVAIARTIVHDPPVLILDEPSFGLDVPSARLIERFILEARDQGKCIVFSTHVMEEAEYLCDRIAVVHQGKLRIIGTMDELRAATGKTRLREIFLDLLGIEDIRLETRA